MIYSIEKTIDSFPAPEGTTRRRLVLVNWRREEELIVKYLERPDGNMTITILSIDGADRFDLIDRAVLQLMKLVREEVNESDAEIFLDLFGEMLDGDGQFAPDPGFPNTTFPNVYVHFTGKDSPK